MNTKWLLIGGLLDGEIKEINDNFVKEGRLVSFLERPIADVLHHGLIAVHYKMIVRGAITDVITGGVLAHESLSPVQAYKMLILHYQTKIKSRTNSGHMVDESDNSNPNDVDSTSRPKEGQPTEESPA